MNGLTFTLEHTASTRERAHDLMQEWYSAGIMDRSLYRRADELAAKCSDSLGEMPDNDMTHGFISAWLRKEIGDE